MPPDYRHGGIKKTSLDSDILSSPMGKINTAFSLQSKSFLVLRKHFNVVNFSIKRMILFSIRTATLSTKN